MHTGAVDALECSCHAEVWKTYICDVVRWQQCSMLLRSCTNPAAEAASSINDACLRKCRKIYLHETKEAQASVTGEPFQFRPDCL